MKNYDNPTAATVVIRGGLGNQLFQYAFAKYLEHTLGQTVQLLISPVRLAGNKTSQELFLSHYQIPLNRCSESVVTHYLNEISPSLFHRIQRKIKKQLLRQSPVYIPETPPIQFKIHHFTLSDIQGKILDGYWQNTHYAMQVYNDLKNELQLKAPLSQQNSDMLAQIKSVKHSVSIHVRALDHHVKNNDGSLRYALQGADYYNAALTTLQNHVPNPHYFVFSDNVDSAKKLLQHIPNTTFVTHNSHHDGHLDLYLQSQCDHNIIADSTFSWWAAILNPNPNKKILYPAHFYNDPEKNRQCMDAFPKEWIRI